MRHHSATASANSNIALIKYWGNRDDRLRLPANGSISMNLKGLDTVTTVEFLPELQRDEVILHGQRQSGAPHERVAAHLDRIRAMAGITSKARVISENNFPTGAGIASSASAFAALSLAGTAAAGLRLSERELSVLARLGSGSASRSVPAGFVEWKTGERSEDSYAFTIAPPEQWALVDWIAIVSRQHKAVGSTEGHALAHTSPLQAGRVADAPRRLDLCRESLMARDFAAFAEIVEADSNLMHAVMMTSAPSLFYWQPATLTVMEAIRRWRAEGLQVCYTIDAGPNVHGLCTSDSADDVGQRLRALPGVEDVLRAEPGPGAELVAGR